MRVLAINPTIADHLAADSGRYPPNQYIGTVLSERDQNWRSGDRDPELEAQILFNGASAPVTLLDDATDNVGHVLLIDVHGGLVAASSLPYAYDYRDEIFWNALPTGPDYVALQGPFALDSERRDDYVLSAPVLNSDGVLLGSIHHLFPVDYIMAQTRPQGFRNNRAVSGC